MSPRGEPDRGSVLVDALVAIGVMTLTLAFAAQAIGDGALRTGAGERARLADLEARSRLAEVGGDIPLTPGRTDGEDGTLAWRVEVAREPSVTTPMLSVVVTVSPREGGGGLVTLRSLRIGAA